VRVVIDMNLSARLVDDLKAAGIETEHWSVAGTREGSRLYHGFRTR
jgi:predicted nuclease of predicted toxin-antitoxin system